MEVLRVLENKFKSVGCTFAIGLLPFADNAGIVKT